MNQPVQRLQEAEPNKRCSLDFARALAIALGLQFPVEVAQFGLEVPLVGSWNPDVGTLEAR